jgi:peptidoglycan-N-acetylglucosamine deacetylase
MKPASYITTSWDDGHPSDLRLADLLTKYNLSGTFYIPKSAEHGIMTTAQMRELSKRFEIGAHTLGHVVLTTASDDKARQEIVGSKSWVEDITGQPCRMFCPPTGRFSRRHQMQVQAAGFQGLRSVELLSLDMPRRQAGLMVMPTTVQAHPHGSIAYLKNAIKRTAVSNLANYIAHGRMSEWPQLAQSMLEQSRSRGGVFHLWGHSWELDANDQWRRLEDVLRLMVDASGEARALTNGALCQQSWSHVTGHDGARPHRHSHGFSK